MLRIIDISPVIGPATAVWPGDTALERFVALEIGQGHNLTLSSVSTTVHIGAHADAPSHYTKLGPTIDLVDLSPYIGPCRVVSCNKPRGSLIGPEDLREVLKFKPERVLVKTLSYPNPQNFNQDFVSFSPQAIDLLGEAGVVLVGIDTPSVDPFLSKDLLAHHALWRYNIRNLEQLDLSGVTDGAYELIALPLKLEGFDGSPVRAILRDF